MSTSTFRTAFWVLGVAFGLTVLLVVPNPERLRFAKRAEQRQELPHQATLLVQQSNPGERPAAASSSAAENPWESRPAPLDASLAQRNRTVGTSGPVTSLPDESLLEDSPQSSPPLRVASANPQATLGTPPIDGRLASIFDRSEASEVPQWAAQPNATTRDDHRHRSELEIRVPDPIEMQSPAATGSLPDETLIAPSISQSHGPVPSATGTIGDPWRSPDPVDTQSSTVRAPASSAAGLRIAATPTSSQNRTPTLSKQQEYELQRSAISWRTEPRIEIVTGDEFGTWTFRFDNAPLPHVLQALGDYAGRPVVVSPQLQGRYTGEFLNADPMQLLAILIRLHDCSVDRCGKYFVVESRQRVE